jgi:two-component system chemotaxis response regulator CheY
MSKKILIAIECDIIRRVFKKWILENGYSNIFEAIDGNEAVAVYQDKKPELVFLELSLPKKDGFSVLTEIRGINPKAYVVMLGNSQQKLMIIDYIKLGASNFLAIPDDYEKLPYILNNNIE